MVLLLFMSANLLAQGNMVTVKGKVVDALSDDPLIGVTVKEVGSSRGSVTDLDGSFNLQVKTGATVEFSYVSYKTRSFKANSIPATVKMEESTE